MTDEQWNSLTEEEKAILGTPNEEGLVPGFTLTFNLPEFMIDMIINHFPKSSLQEPVNGVALTGTVEEFKQYTNFLVENSAKKHNSSKLYMLYIGDVDSEEGKVVALMGNGPNSEHNATIFSLGLALLKCIVENPAYEEYVKSKEIKNDSTSETKE